jgi:hypothetical protein
MSENASSIFYIKLIFPQMFISLFSHIFLLMSWFWQINFSCIVTIWIGKESCGCCIQWKCFGKWWINFWWGEEEYITQYYEWKWNIVKIIEIEGYIQYE